MKTSIIETHTFLQTSLFKVELLSELLRSKSYSFFAEIERWLTDNEAVLKQLGFVESGRMSILQNQMFVAQQTDMQQKRKHLFLTGAGCLEVAHDVLSVLHEPIHAKITQGRETIQQILIMIEEEPQYQQQQEEDFDVFVKRLWSDLRQDPQYSAVTIQLLTLLPQVDIYRIIAEEIEL